jgi:hypothetical protein
MIAPGHLFSAALGGLRARQGPGQSFLQRFYLRSLRSVELFCRFDCPSLYFSMRCLVVFHSKGSDIRS